MPIDPEQVSDFDDAEYTVSGLIWAALDVELTIATADVPATGVRPARPTTLPPTPPQRSRIRSELELTAIDPPRRQRAPWRSLYAPELDGHIGVGFDLDSQSPIAAVARRAKLTPAELDVFRLWAAGDSPTSIARTLRRQRGTVTTLLARALWRLRALDRRRAAE